MGPEIVSTDRVFEVSAPAKAIVCGEHAVVYGKSAVAVALSLRTSLRVEPLSSKDNAALLRLSLPDLQHDLEWDSVKLPWKALQTSATGADHRPTTEQMVAIDSAVTTACACPTTKGGPLCRAVARAFLFLYMSLTDPSAPGCSFTLRSQIPIGAGLGSSGSICVCLATALLARANRIATSHPPHLTPADLSAVNRWALAGEVCTHGTPSGVDNAISTWGGVLLYRRAPPSPSPSSSPSSVCDSAPHQPPCMQFLPASTTAAAATTPPPISVLLIDTNQPRSTRAQVDKVAAFAREYPVYAATLLAAIDALSREAATLFSAGSLLRDDDDGDDGVRKLGALMRLNHRLLAALGVSHPRLERACDIVEGWGVGYAKLTGAGGGGCVLVLLKPGVVEDGEALRGAEEELAGEGFRVIAASIRGVGVSVSSGFG